MQRLSGKRHSWRGVIVLVALAAAAALAPPLAQARSRFDIRVLAHVPAPGYPALTLIAPDRTIYVGTFYGAAGGATGPSKVFAYSPGGKLERTYTITGETPNGTNGVQVAARDAQGRLYLLDQSPPRMLTLDPRTGRQRTYATFRDVPTCTTAPPGTRDCSDTVTDNPPEPDYAAWGTDGSLYVTDYQQGLIWRVPPGGGTAHVWFTDPRIDGTLFGPAGIVLLPDHHTLLFSSSASGAVTGQPTDGGLWKLGIKSNGSPGTLSELWRSGPREAPDGFARARSGNLYVALVGPGANQVVEISPGGKELARFPGASQNAQMSVPFDEPSSVQFDGDRMIITNDPYFDGNTARMVLFDVWAGEPGAAVYLPPASVTGRHGRSKRRYSLSVRPRRVLAGRAVRLRFSAIVRRGRRWRAFAGALIRIDGRKVRTDRHGDAVLTVTFHSAGRYTARLMMRGRKHHRLATVHVRVVAPPRR